MSQAPSPGSDSLAFAQQLGDASARFDGRELTISTGVVRRVWRVTANGLMTVSLRREAGGEEWIKPPADGAGCDWRIFDLVEADAAGVPTSARAVVVPAEGSLTERLQVEVIFQYPASNVEVRYVVWSIPGAGGLRTQLSLRALGVHDGDLWPGYLVDSYAEKLLFPAGATGRHAAGYYNDTQHRNSHRLPMLREERRTGVLTGGGSESYDWANLLHLRRADDGLALVKESHKCVNQEGVDTGAFILERDSVTVTGLGLRINGYGDTSPWLRSDEWHVAWANWCVPYAGGETEGVLAVKHYDHTRFPHDPTRDVYMNANTWGSRGAGRWSQSAATEANVLREIASCADLGIDVLQIDDGWQINDGQGSTDTDWRPVASRFPQGWAPVRGAAEAAGVQLGLWFACTAPVERINENCDAGGFRYIKLDFADLRFRHLVDALLAKAREIDRHSGHRARVTWDLTEVSPRVGYFLGREYGHLYVRNTQWTRPGTRRTRHVAYRPDVILRDAWQFARHLNLRQICLNVQNKDRFPPDEAGRYSHGYCFALTMMGLPTFMQETHLYSDEARSELRPLIACYKKHRQRILAGDVTPVGHEPDGRSWTGLHCGVSATEGYLTVFREADNGDANHALHLPMLEPGAYAWTDLPSGETTESTLGDDRVLACQMASPAGFRFLGYRRLG